MARTRNTIGRRHRDDALTGPAQNKRADAAGSWLVSPAFDLMFVVNVPWLLAWLPGFLSVDGTPHVEFWQIYFLTTPHRWITLLLVATDRDRRGERAWLFALIALVSAAVVLGVWQFTGAFTCLLLIDYVWNGWHFAAQHGGILRMYSRKHGGGRPRLETWGLRCFVFYTTMRLAGWSTGWLESQTSGRSLLTVLDVAAMCLPAALVALELSREPWRRPGKVSYLASVSGLYAGLLFAVVYQQRNLILALTAASAAFHAIEYLAIVTLYAMRRTSHGSAGAFREMARHWWQIFALYVVLVGVVARMADWWMREAWLGLNLWAAYVHYAFDGLIWKLRKPQTAEALGVELTAPATESAA